MKLLGRKGVHPDSSSKYGRTLLSWATRNVHEGIVKLLLGREDFNPGIPNTICDQTQLSRATENGYEGIMKLLLGREDVNHSTCSISVKH